MAQAVQKASTRETYGKTLVELGREKPSIVVLGGDLNQSTFTYLFAREFPERFFDFGVAEQNIIGVAAGMASAGKIPFVSTFAVFGTGRPFDQLRVSVAQPHLNVKLVCTHSGIITGEDGMSAHGVEDLALASSLVGFTVIAPADSVETEKAVRAAVDMDGPVYIRLYRVETPIVHHDGCDFQIGKAELMRQGDAVTIIATGSMVAAALEAADALSAEGIRCRVLNMHTLKPLDEEAVVASSRETGAVVTAEEHYIHGGLSSAVAQVLSHRHPTPMESVALTRYAESGKPDELLEKYHLTAEDIRAAVKRVLERKKA